MKLLNGSSNQEKSFNNSSKIENSVPIPTYAPNQSLQPKAYLLSPRYLSFENNFERRCKVFLQKAKADQFNGKYMDALIQKMVKDALVYLSLQRGEHIDVITNLLGRMYIGDKIKCESKLNQALREQNELVTEVAKIRSIYYKGTSFED